MNCTHAVPDEGWYKPNCSTTCSLFCFVLVQQQKIKCFQHPRAQKTRSSLSFKFSQSGKIMKRFLTKKFCGLRWYFTCAFKPCLCLYISYLDSMKCLHIFCVSVASRNRIQDLVWVFLVALTILNLLGIMAYSWPGSFRAPRRKNVEEYSES